jgi:hypothetical protein
MFVFVQPLPQDSKYKQKVSSSSSSNYKSRRQQQRATVAPYRPLPPPSKQHRPYYQQQQHQQQQQKEQAPPPSYSEVGVVRPRRSHRQPMMLPPFMAATAPPEALDSDSLSETETE